jgi:hypothetical protein
MVALHYAVSPTWPTDIASARAEVDRLLADVPVAAWSAKPEQVRRVARRCLETAAAAQRRLERVGDRPVFDDSTATNAIDACAGVARARAARQVAAADARRLFTIGNAWGALGLLGAGALVSRGVDPMSSFVFGAISAAAAGPVTTSAIALWQRSLATIRVDAARAAWGRALIATGFDTMGDLHAGRISVRAWERRDAEARAAVAAAEDAEREWLELVGDEIAAADAPALASRLTAARAAQLALIHAYLDAHYAQRRHARPEPKPPRGFRLFIL